MKLIILNLGFKKLKAIFIPSIFGENKPLIKYFSCISSFYGFLFHIFFKDQ